MALLKYLKPAKYHLSNPRGSLAASGPSRTVAQANLGVQQWLYMSDDKEEKGKVLTISILVFCVIYYYTRSVAILLCNTYKK